MDTNLTRVGETYNMFPMKHFAGTALCVDDTPEEVTYRIELWPVETYGESFVTITKNNPENVRQWGQMHLRRFGT